MRKSVLFIFICLILISLVEGFISIDDDFRDVYNINDKISINYSIDSQKDIEDYVSVYLYCNDDNFIVKKDYLVLNKNQKKIFNYDFPLNFEKSGTFLTGECRVYIEYAKDTGKSSEFYVSDEIKINSDINNKFFLPGEPVSIKGGAIKENGEGFEGAVRIYNKDLFDKTVKVKDGKFSFNFDLRSDADPGVYNFSLFCFEKNDAGLIINSGKVYSELEILSKPSEISLIGPEDILPGKKVDFKVLLLDQSGEIVSGESLLVKLLDANQDIKVPGKTVKSGQNFSYYFEDNASRGQWSLDVVYGDLHFLKSIYIKENKKLSIDVLNDSERTYIHFENIGNVEYDGVVDIFLNNNTDNDTSSYNFSYNLQHLNISEVRNVNLREILGSALNEGDYNLTVDGVEFTGVRITGAAASYNSDIGLKSFVISFIFIFLLIFLVLVRKKKKFFNIFKKSSKPKKEKNAYMIFFKMKTKEDVLDLEKTLKKHKFSINKAGKNEYFILSYSISKKRFEKSLIRLVNNLRKEMNLNKSEFSAVLNCRKFVNKASFLKNYSLTTQKLLNYVDGFILIEKSIAVRLGLDLSSNYKPIKINDETYEFYEL